MNKNYTIKGTEFDGKIGYTPPKYEWKCYLFGSTDENPMVIINIEKGKKVPNRFQRYMSKIFFGNTWVNAGDINE